MFLNRRELLRSAAATAFFGGFAIPPVFRSVSAAEDDATLLRIQRRTIEVSGRPASVFGILREDGRTGIETEAGRRFRVTLENRIDKETLIHWHGLTPPWEQDGVPGLSQPPLPAGQAYDYDFPLARPGTFWMHSHHGLTEQQLMAAPLIVRDPAEAGEDVQEVVVLFHDFSFREPEEILAGLRGGAAHGAAAGAMDHAAKGHGGPGAPVMEHAAPASPGGVHLNDVEYDAFLANDRTLDDPEVHRVEPGARVRLRLINGATASNFWIDLDRLYGRLIAVDGMPVEPLTASRFPFASGQRLDIRLDLPKSEGAWPIFAQREGDAPRTGIVLATRTARIPKQPARGAAPLPAIGLDLEARLRAFAPLLERKPDRSLTIRTEEAPGYVWRLTGPDGAQPLRVRAGERVEITIVDETTMAHPIHLHGHPFQVVAVNGRRFLGAVRDTVLVPPRTSVTIAFEADNPGRWALHCHHLYHMAAGMMTAVEYET